jgi:hypothetical protein
MDKLKNALAELIKEPFKEQLSIPGNEWSEYVIRQETPFGIDLMFKPRVEGEPYRHFYVSVVENFAGTSHIKWPSEP